MSKISYIAFLVTAPDDCLSTYNVKALIGFSLLSFMFSIQDLSFLLCVRVVSNLIRPYARIKSPDSTILLKMVGISKIIKAANNKNLS